MTMDSGRFGSGQSWDVACQVAHGIDDPFWLRQLGSTKIHGTHESGESYRWTAVG